MQAARLHAHASSQAHKHAATHKWTHTPAEPPNCPNCGVLGEEFNSEWVALQVLGIICLRVNVRQKDKDGHFTGHWLLLPDDQPHHETLLFLCMLGSVVQLQIVPVEMLWLYPFPQKPGLILNPCLNVYINVCSCMSPNVVLISVLYYVHPESRLWNRIRALVEVISQFWVCICSIDLQYVNSCNAGLAYGPSASLEACPAWCLITERLSRVLSVN